MSWIDMIFFTFSCFTVLSVISAGDSDLYGSGRRACPVINNSDGTVAPAKLTNLADVVRICQSEPSKFWCGLANLNRINCETLFLS